jgi:hypothetical protein
LRRNTLDEAISALLLPVAYPWIQFLPGTLRTAGAGDPTPAIPAEFYQNGVKAITVEMTRYIPQAKTINYIPAMIALKRAKAVNAIEALYVNSQGHILEGTTTNLFVFKGSDLLHRLRIFYQVLPVICVCVSPATFDLLSNLLTLSAWSG